jgi:hypothetical protein
MTTIPEPPIAGDDTATMLGSLERQRATFAWKCSGVDREGLQATVGASDLTLGGLLLHLALVEDLYFSARLGGANIRGLWPDAAFDDPDWEWHAAAGRPPEVLLSDWQLAVRRSRAVLDELLDTGDLDQIARHSPWDPPPSIRRVLADLVEEYARHTGHADLIREAVDGVTGEDPPPDLPGYPR